MVIYLDIVLEVLYLPREVFVGTDRQTDCLIQTGRVLADSQGSSAPLVFLSFVQLFSLGFMDSSNITKLGLSNIGAHQQN